MNASEQRSNELTTADIVAYKQAQVAKAARELADLLQRHGVKMVAEPVLTSDGRIAAQVRLIYDDDA
jgi:hypothetical protein